MTTRNTYSGLSQSDIAIQIARLVLAIEKHDIPGFRIKQTRSGYDRIEETRLSRYFDHIQQMINLFDGRREYRYSEHLQAFWEACQDIGLERGAEGPVCLNEDGTEWQTRGVASSDLLARITGVDPIPNVPEAQWVSHYQALIQQNLHLGSDGRVLRERLEAHFGAQHPVMRECDRMLRLQSFKQRLPRDLGNEER